MAGNDWKSFREQRTTDYSAKYGLRTQFRLQKLVKLIDQVSLKLEFQQMKEAGTYKADSEGIWEAALAVPNIGLELF